MKQLLIKKLILKDFKGQSRDVDLYHNTLIQGGNGIGKSILMRGWFWLLTGYTDAQNAKNFNLYDETKELNENTPIAGVKASISIDNIDYTLERNAKASFSKPRGEDYYVKDSSDKYTYKIDDIDISVQDWKSWIEGNICPIDMIQFLVNGEFFGNLSLDDKDKARKTLENIIGEIKKEDYKDDYKILFKMMERFPIEALKEQTKERMKPIKQRIKEFPALIEQKEKDIADLESNINKNIEKEIEEYNNKIADIDKQLKGSSDNIKIYIDKRNAELLAIENKKRDLAEREREYNDTSSVELRNLQKQLQDIDNINYDIEQSNKDLQNKRKRDEERLLQYQKELELLNSQRDTLLRQRDEVKARVFNADKCNYCGQELPIDMIEEKRDKFNKQKEDELHNIISQGKLTRDKIETLKKEIEGLKEKTTKKLDLKQQKNKDDIENKIKEEEAKITDFKATKEYFDAISDIAELNDNLTAIPKQDNEDLSLEKADLMSKLADLNKEKGKEIAIDMQKQSLLELQEEQKKQGIELAKLEKLEAQINAYIEEKANIISCRVNDLLDFCKIEMQERQKDGKLKPTANIHKQNNVKYADINQSDKILIMIDLQMMFNKYYNIALPIWIDEASTIDLTRVPKADEWQKIFIKYEDCKFECKELK